MLGYAPKQKTMLIELSYYWDRGGRTFFLGGIQGLFKTFQQLLLQRYLPVVEY